MIALVRSASVCSLLILLSGCGIADSMGLSADSARDCTVESDGAHTINFVDYVAASSLAEAQQAAELVVEGTITAVGRFSQPLEEIQYQSASATVLRHYTLQVDTYYKGQGAEQLDVFIQFNGFFPGDCPVDEALLEANFYPQDRPQFEVGERYVLYLSSFPGYCTDCYSLTATPSMFHIQPDGSMDMLIAPDAKLAVSQSLQLDNRPLRDQVDEALRQLSSPAPTATSLPRPAPENRDQATTTERSSL